MSIKKNAAACRGLKCCGAFSPVHAPYFGAFLYRYIAMNRYNMFGIHTAMAGERFPLMAKVDDMVWNRMYEKLNANPIPKCRPMPPFTLRDDSDSPIAVRINAANEVAMRR